ncbi:MAG: phage minor head protein [Pseudomonadota bacterium]
MNMLGTHFNGKLTEISQREAGNTHYIWHTQSDELVCNSHAPNHGKVFAWDNPPPTGHPGEDYNCRCTPIPFSPSALGIDDPPIEPSFIIEKLIIGGIIAKVANKAATAIGAAVGKVFRRNNTEEQIAEPNVPPATRNPNEIEIPVDPVTIRPEGVPEDWVKKKSKKKDGYRYIDPNNKHNDIRVQKRNPKSDYLNSRNDYVRWKKDGRWLDKDGKPSIDEEKTHIPLDEFKFNPDIFK